MLDRPARIARAPPPRSRPDRDRRYRQRQRDGRIVVQVEVDLAILDFLLAAGWASEEDLADRAAIGEAVGRMLQDTARRR